MEIKGDIYSFNKTFHQKAVLFFPPPEFNITKIIAICNPIIDISSNIEKESIKKYNLENGNIIFSDENNLSFFDIIENNPKVNYSPGGNVLNIIRIASWLSNMEEKTKDKFSLTLLGAIGQDEYKNKIIDSLKSAGVKPLLQIIPNISTSKCGIGLYNKERYLISQINASNYLTKEFIEEHENEIYENDALLIEGYFLKENYEICKNLCLNFKRANKYIILTLSSVYMIKSYKDKIIEIAENSNMILSSMKEIKAFADTEEETPEKIFIKAHQKLHKKNRLFVVSDGINGVYVSKYDYKMEGLEFILHSYPSKIKNKENEDFDGKGYAFFGGFLHQFMKENILENCCKIGNDVSGIIRENGGSNLPRDKIIKLEKTSDIV